MKQNHIYSISRGYKKATVWSGSKMTGARVCTSTCTPKSGLTRPQRHAEIAAWLYSRFGIPGPCYREKELS